MRGILHGTVAAALVAGACAREATAPAPGEPGSAPPQALATSSVEELRAALASYEEVRLLLSVDRADGLAAPAGRLAAGLAAAAAVGEPCLAGVAAARRLAEASDLAGARQAFGEVSRCVLGLGALDPRVREGWHVFACPMTGTFDRWIQGPPEIANPYMGLAMPSCGMPSDWGEATAGSPSREPTS